MPKHIMFSLRYNSNVPPDTYACDAVCNKHFTNYTVCKCTSKLTCAGDMLMMQLMQRAAVNFETSERLPPLKTAATAVWSSGMILA